MDTKDIERNIGRAAALLKAMANEKRLTLLCLLHNGETSVGDLEKIVGLSQSALSQHLARLRRDGLVKTRREAQTIYYSTDNEEVNAVLACLKDCYGCNQKDN